MAEPVSQYLQRHAEPEARLDIELPQLERAIVIPVRRESVDCLRGMEAVAARRPRLVILVVNAAMHGDDASVEANAVLLHALTGRREPDPVQLVAHRGLQVLVIDRSSPGRGLPSDRGVGLARRIGCDVALSAWSRGRLRSPWIRTTDADATLHPGDLESPSDTVAVLRPIWHVPCGDAALDRATARYELWLRYYVAGLAWAGSPWAMMTVGSAIAVDGAAYAKVRGMPRRPAGEDFHLLCKLAKLGPIAQRSNAPVHILSRRSDRVPFGTGPATARLAEAMARGQASPFYDPRCFAALRTLLEAFEVAAAGRCEAPSLPQLWWDAVRDRIGGWSTLQRTLARSDDPGMRRRRLHEWLDGIRTLRFIHAVRDLSAPSLPHDEAMQRAPFVPRRIDLGDPLLHEARFELGSLAPTRAGLPTSTYRLPG